MSNADSVLGSRIDSSPGTGRLALGDLLVLVGLLVAGSLRHNTTGILQIADTIAPFFVGWVVAALAVGAYAPGATKGPKTAAIRAGGTWLVAAAIGLALRATSFFHGDSPLPFVLVIAGTGLVAFVGWRVAVSVLGR
ncbi:DUF3054 domain-containing protein [Halorussus halophilus]|uniref:DUF3054 domain-containing protein n=1 Tax=Halorussus halophilus TaxID=2650975 RepID=UPI001301863F|nr:DUF3054 domain-containing protein [Halorussus halophilus]